MSPHVLCIGGEDHALRIPFLAALGKLGFRVTAAGTGDAKPFARAGVTYLRYSFDRFANPQADWRAVGQLARMRAEVRPDIVQCFDTKPNLLAPIVISGATGRAVQSVRDDLVYSCRHPLAVAGGTPCS